MEESRCGPHKASVRHSSVLIKKITDKHRQGSFCPMYNLNQRQGVSFTAKYTYYVFK